jgi:hypothetical protein
MSAMGREQPYYITLTVAPEASDQDIYLTGL